MKPFRFMSQPSAEEINLELGNDYSQCLNYDKTAVRKPVECLTWPVYNWDTNSVQVLEVSHVSLGRQFAKYGLNKKYSKNLLDWDFELSKIKADMVRYELLIVPRDEDEHDEVAMAKAWKAVQKDGFDLNRIVVGGDPFSELDPWNLISLRTSTITCATSGQPVIGFMTFTSLYVIWLS